MSLTPAPGDNYWLTPPPSPYYLLYDEYVFEIWGKFFGGTSTKRLVKQLRGRSKVEKPESENWPDKWKCDRKPNRKKWLKETKANFQSTPGRSTIETWNAQQMATAKKKHLQVGCPRKLHLAECAFSPRKTSTMFWSSSSFKCWAKQFAPQLLQYKYLKKIGNSNLMPDSGSKVEKMKPKNPK